MQFAVKYNVILRYSFRTQQDILLYGLDTHIILLQVEYKWQFEYTIYYYITLTFFAAAIF
jgi:hypothetical protein